MNNVHYSSHSNEWETPKDLFNKLKKKYNFKLDAAATQKNALCENYFTIQNDALIQDWYQYKSIFLNPPYGRAISKFIKKAYEESLKGCVVVCLIPARTDTKYMHNYCFKYGKVEFIMGRLKFTNRLRTPYNGSSNFKISPAPFPSCIVVFGEKNAAIKN
jgi:site-specific DNA-methyltransferase (adenine-specific)